MLISSVLYFNIPSLRLCINMQNRFCLGWAMRGAVGGEFYDRVVNMLQIALGVFAGGSGNS